MSRMDQNRLPYIAFMVVSNTARKSSGNAFHAEGLVCEKARSLNWIVTTRN